jgi:pimeloyl-ACP methyl ester carboxylesterase
VPEAAIEKHIAVIGNRPAMAARVPALLIWGDADDTVGRIAAKGTAAFITAPDNFAPLAGVGHYAADQVPELVNTLMLAHLARHPV